MSIYEESTIQDMYFTTPAMKRIFSDAHRVQRQMDCEAALAETEAELGIIPQDAATEIVKKSKTEYLDFDALRADMVRTGHPFVALVHAYKVICDGSAGEYVHWGATTQDILDTAAVLQNRDAYEIIIGRAEELYRLLAESAFRYKDLVMAGRSNGQQAMPITFGYKIAVWGFELRDDIDRMHESEKRVFKGQFGGAVGTLASLGEDGLRVQEGFLQRLHLEPPPIAWSSSRSHNAEFLSNLAIMAATLGKIGTEVYALQKSEIRELEEAQGAGSVGSSTMPHKRNPFRAMELSTNAKLIRGCAEVMLSALETEHERDPRSASVESKLFEQAFSLLDASLTKAIGLVRGLQVHPQEMRTNLDALHGLIYSEAVMMRLGQHLGRQTAHDIVHALSKKAFEESIPLAQLLEGEPRVHAVLRKDEIAALMQPEAYVGQAPYFAEKLKAQMEEYFVVKEKV